MKNDTGTTIRDAVVADHDAILALNLESEVLVSPMDAGRLRLLDAQSAYNRVVEIDGQVAAFLLAFREGAEYDSPNYRWFAERYPRFLYVDRIIVSETYQGRQLGRKLYEDLFAFAKDGGVETITCEFYVVPFNEASSRFHAKFGLHEVGQQWVSNDTKQVSLQIATP
jgi:uncharacterized protein